MTSRRDAPPDRTTILANLRNEHRPRYDSVDAVYWGCICAAGAECLYIILVEALNKSEQKTIGVMNDLRREYDNHRVEVHSLSSTIAGLETYNRRLKEENDALQGGRDQQVP